MTVDLPTFELVFRRQGFRTCDDASLEDGWEKVAIYVDVAGRPTHAARQLESGRWASKLGKLDDIEHDDLEDVGGADLYGTVAIVMRRRRRDLPHPLARNL